MGYNEMLSAMDMEIQTPYFKDAFDKMPEYVKAMMRALLRGLELVTNDGVDDFNRVSIDFNEYVYEVGARRYPFQSVKELAKAALARIFVEFDMWLFGAWIDLWDDDHLYTDKKGRTRIYYMFTKRFASMMLHCKDTVMGEEINPDDYKYPVEIHFIKDGDDEYYVAFLPDFGFSACAAAAGDTEEEAVQNLRDVKKFVIGQKIFWCRREIGMVNAEVLVNEINMLPPEARALLYELLPYAVKQCAENPGKPFYETNCDLDRFLEVVGKCRADFSNDAEIMELAYSSMSNISFRIDAFLFWTERGLFERCRVFNNRIHYVFSKQFAASLTKHEKELVESRVYVCRGCGKNIDRNEYNE